ncbi:terpene synthase family protein [Streptomyces melanogenes]|uniref:terpene synthase family protein n=1 Tax=Streptomyces melanogenes TaxID=67326 RepID=UPI00167C757E|nr:hypothetical protein [Streptomyces melanogenes]GGP95229.1 hypothetical protein GCM10010278_86290 [Streptomyces melanogenes]
MDNAKPMPDTIEEWLAGPVLLPEVELDMPFPPCWSSDPLPALRQRYVDWLRKFGLITTEDQAKGYLRHCIAELSVLSYPEAKGARLDMGYDLISITVLFSDFFDTTSLGQDPSQVARAIRELVRLTLEPPGTEPGVSAHPAVWAFADAWGRETEGMSPAWQARASANWRAWFSTWLIEASNRFSGHLPSTSEYVSHRRESAAIGAYRDSFESANQCECPSAILDSAQMRIAFEAYGECIGLVNDIYSSNVESSRKDVHNMVTVLEGNQGLSREAAIAETARKSNQAVARMQHLTQSLSPLYDAYQLSIREREAADRFLAGLGHTLRANLEFSRRSARYETSLLLGDGSYSYLTETPSLLAQAQDGNNEMHPFQTESTGT